ncbi:aminotransferase class III-fold pyridoxal phosphate-dependent enzyme [Robiginitalea sp. M366]|uniref:aminotransferase class III-fold pyridoxal phosphate-dependent enzyme n=1 Tax=Robiginitalea aestuariiviva TaxID=3036903 RepID=UPI00240D0716|nr:aminotransferase class III-fold pyridoxal phosphate-dependent enzyme [Robiginitalea aestuariiviva]MDG1572858.1 aminotransferase class III-fold pyridoxal phosphate-dependent enzyme [Robiginitalea aestuariiviva]
MQDVFKAIAHHYGITASRLKPLEGYEDRTFLLEGPQGRWIYKEHRERPGCEARIDLEADLMAHYAQAPRFTFPKTLQTRQGANHFKRDGCICRLLEFLEGDFLAEVSHTPVLLESVGALLGVSALRAATFTAVCPPAEPSSWDLQHLSLSLEYLPEVSDPRIRTLIAYFAQQFRAQVLPLQYKLRKGFIHNDANDWNLLVGDGGARGLIDFGDATYSWLAGDLAVGLTYALMTKEAPLEAASQVLCGYRSITALEETEADLLYYLVAARLCMSLCQSAHAAKLRPESDYVAISETAARQLLQQWVRISPEQARRSFRKALQLPVSHTTDPDTFARRRKNLLSPSLSLSYKRPIIMERAALQYMYAQDGTTFLDAYNNIMLVGHCHPEVVACGAAAMRKLNTNTRYHYDVLLDYAEKLLATFPPELSRVFLVNSGSAATDLALRLARHVTGKRKIMALEYGYHGNTEAAIAVSHYKHQPGQAYPNTLLCPMPKAFGSSYPDTGEAGNAFAAPALETAITHGTDLAAFLAEPIMGCGGQVPLPQGYLEAIYPEVRRQGGLCISDEVQVGFGRLGKYFWGFEQYGVTPDMVILGKPMGNGHPLGAVVCTQAVAEAFASGPEFFSSFGGNPVSCAVGLAVLDVLEAERLPEHAAGVGAFLIQELQGLQQRYPVLANVRGQGLFLGVECLQPDGRPATNLARALKNELREQQVLIGTDGPDDNVLKIKPPLPFSRANAGELVEKLDGILRKLS